MPLSRSRAISISDLDVLIVLGGGWLNSAMVTMHNVIQINDVITVTLVKASPALAPNALCPPMPPKAPVSPPPLPR